MSSETTPVVFLPPRPKVEAWWVEAHGPASMDYVGDWLARLHANRPAAAELYVMAMLSRFTSKPGEVGRIGVCIRFGDKCPAGLRSTIGGELVVVLATAVSRYARLWSDVEAWQVIPEPEVLSGSPVTCPQCGSARRLCRSCGREWGER